MSNYSCSFKCITYSSIELMFYVFIGSLLDFLKSEAGCKIQLPKLIDFSAQVLYVASISHQKLLLNFGEYSL